MPARRVAAALLVALAVSVVAACSGGGAGDTHDGGGKGGDPVERDRPSTSSTWAGPVLTGSFEAVIPRPSEVRAATGSFVLAGEIAVEVEGGAPAGDAASLLRRRLAESGVESGGTGGGDGYDGSPARPSIVLTAADADRDLGDEGYRLSIRPDGVEVRARGHDGFVWGAQTLAQLLPASRHEIPEGGAPALPAGDVRDVPRYRWRGVMLDVARHFFGVDDIERVAELASAYKLNRLHLHLTDDQGWRLAMTGHPELTEIGSRTEVGGGPGGFLTQDDYRRIVEHARRLGVTVVPEIDMPGHTNAALVSLPHLNCDGRAPEPYTGMAVGFSSLCVDADSTYTFVREVVGELAGLTPGRWIHIGGDESRATAPDGYRRFVARALETVRAAGKVPVGWEEIGTTDLSAGPVVAQHWIDPAPAARAAEGGAELIMSPANRVYLDMKYDASTPGNAWAGLIDTRTAYSWDPDAAVPGVRPSRVLGVEAPLWAELVTTRADIDARLLPRLPAVAEVAWTDQGERRWDDFRTRVAGHAARWVAAGYGYTRDPDVAWPPER